MKSFATFQAYYSGGAMELGPARRLASWRRYRRVALEVDKLGSDLLVLDLGCGRGYVARQLATRHRLVGVDVARQPLEEFAEYGLAVVADACSLPFDDAIFDVVICGQALYHLDLDRAIREMSRVTKHGGHLVLEQGMLIDVSLWPLLVYWGIRRRLPGRLRLLYQSRRDSWLRLRHTLERHGFASVQRIGLEISTGPFLRRQTASRLDLVADTFWALASQQLIVCVRR